MSEVISTANAPEAIGPYIQGSIAGNFVFTSGQLPIDPATDMIADCAADQTRQSLENIKAIINAAGLSVGDI